MPVEEEQLKYYVIYWALGFLVALIAALWKAAAYRGEMNAKWSGRVGLLQSGLNEKGVQELENLRRKIDELLGSETDVDVAAIAEPSELLLSVKKFGKLMKILRQVEPQFRWLLGIGNFAVISLLLMTFGVIADALYLSNLFKSQYLIISGSTILCVGLFLGAACWVVFWKLENKLSYAEIESQLVVE